MKMINLKRLALLLVGLIGGLTLLVKASNGAQTVPYDEKNTEIKVTASQPYFIIKLASNPSTGYSWTLHKYDEKYLTLSKHHFVAAKSGMIGGGGAEAWAFTVKPAAFSAPNKMALTFTYARPWEKDNVETGKTVEFTVST